jgi:hypothetical protein
MWLRRFAVLSALTPLITLVIWVPGRVPVGYLVFVQVGALGLAITQWILASAIDRIGALQQVIADKLHVYVEA